MLFLAPLFLAATLQVGSASPGTVLVDTGVGVGLFEVADLAAAVSPAVRLNDDLAAKDGTVPAPTAGWDLSGRVLVETDDAALLVVLASELSPGSRVSPLAGVAGFWLVDAGSVADGVALAAALDGSFGDDAVYLDVRQPHAPRLPNDPMLGQQWHLINNSNPLFDVNIEGAWNAGFTGAGVVVGITDGGVNTSHPDLAANHNSAGSQGGGSSSHGSSCAGVAAAVGDNGIGVTGAAYGAQWSKQYYGFSSTSASAFAYRNDVNDIKNNSWGPSDNGRIHYMTSAEYNALETAATTGRQGRGTIFCWAAVLLGGRQRRAQRPGRVRPLRRQPVHAGDRRHRQPRHACQLQRAGFVDDGRRAVERQHAGHHDDLQQRLHQRLRRHVLGVAARRRCRRAGTGGEPRAVLARRDRRAHRVGADQPRVRPGLDPERHGS
jgi:hypothetical protein